ncbi:hypothetical protein [Streptomyces fragilis]|uniref:DUF7847 domain-containing protein n=1 Tax=Streptomyces fragilis TaxID=67301 RepID=A0ABV2YB68_9ACTN|nr:hypothetical protein [Streptomyces fragilis]
MPPQPPYPYYAQKAWAPQPGVVPLRPLGVGDIIKGTFLAFGRSWLQLLVFALLTMLGVGLLLTVPLVLLGAGDPETTAPASVSLALLGGPAALFVLPALIYVAPMIALRETVVGRKVTLSVLRERIGVRTLRVLGTMLLVMCAALPFFLVAVVGGVCVGVGVEQQNPGGTALAVVGFLVVCAAIVGMVWMGYRLIFAPAITVLEDLGPVASLRRSAALVKGDWWRVFGITYLMGMIVGAMAYVAILVCMLVMMLVTVPLASSAGFSEGADPTWGIAAVVVMVLVGAVMAAVYFLTFALSSYSTGLLYVDQRLRRENFAETLLASAASYGPPGAAPPAAPAGPYPGATAPYTGPVAPYTAPTPPPGAAAGPTDPYLPPMAPPVPPTAPPSAPPADTPPADASPSGALTPPDGPASPADGPASPPAPPAGPPAPR